MTRMSNIKALLIDLENDVIGQEARARVVSQLETVMNKVKWEWHEAGIPV